MSVDDATDGDIAEALQKLMDDGIEAGTYVILEADPSRGYYIQFAWQGGRLFCEAVSNQYLEPDDQLSDAQLRTLENLGWREPETEGQNWFRTFRPSSPADYAEIVRQVRRAFTLVYGVESGGALEMERSWDGQVLTPETAIHFASEGHRTTYEKVASFAQELFGDAVTLDARRPVLFVQYGSALTSVAVNPIDFHATIVDIYALLVREVPTSVELMRWLLAANYSARLGSLSLDGDGDVVLKHSLVGQTITKDELRVVLGVLVGVADKLDDEIVGQFGGFNARDWAHR